jgi:lysophospholipase L1-like esterase
VGQRLNFNPTKPFQANNIDNYNIFFSAKRKGLNNEMSKEKKKPTKRRILAILITIFIASLVLIALSFKILENSPHINTTIRIACVGNSITEGSGYPDDLWMMLGANYTVHNFGVGKSTVLLKSDRPYMNQTAFQTAKDFLPDIVIIMLGTNDAIPNNYQYIDNFVNDYKKLVEAFQALDSNPKIWLVKPPPIYNNTLGPNSTNFVQGVIPRIEQVANEMNLPLIDVYGALAGHPEYFLDGVHLNRQGVKLMATEIYRSINSAIVLSAHRRYSV